MKTYLIACTIGLIAGILGACCIIGILEFYRLLTH